MTSINPSPIPVPTSELLSEEQVQELLQADAAAVKVLSRNTPPQVGDLVGVRLNLNILRNTGEAIQTIHQGTNTSAYKRNSGFYKGLAIGYAQAVVLRNAYFNVSQGGREMIAQGKQHKFPMASVDGQFVGTEVPKDFAGVPISFNPKTQHLFVDPDGHAIHHAEEVVVLGNRVYARGQLKYHTEMSAPARRGDAPSTAKIKPSSSRLNPQFELPVGQLSKRQPQV